MILDMGLLSYSLPIFIGDLINYGGIFFCISCMHSHDLLNICIRKYCVLSLNHPLLNGCNYGIIYGVNSTFFFWLHANSYMKQENLIFLGWKN